MPTHLSARMAWHDNKWNGKICRKPQENSDCVGSYSLLSERLAREKIVDVEAKNPEARIDALLPGYQPPCFWSANAFSSKSANITHVHPFQKLKSKTIQERLCRYSIFTWPFRLAYNHSEEKKKREGNYPIDLESRIKNFLRPEKLKPGDSIVFFYLNYDNPVSADEYKYTLVGCAKLADVGNPTYFDFTNVEMKYWKSQDAMQNFSNMNWAVRISCDFANTGIRLPYHEYLEHVREHPEDEYKLHEMRVLIEEDALIPHFKYVAEEIDDDRCIYLLYKIQKAIEIAQRHGIVKLDREQRLIEKYIQEAWEKRGLYPGLGNVIDLLVDPESDEKCGGNELVATIKQSLSHKEDLLEAIFRLLSRKKIPKNLQKFANTIKRARRGLKVHAGLLSALKKLSLFSLTKFQLRRILFPSIGQGEPHPFGEKNATPEEITSNPYVLSEEYVPVTSKPKLRLMELDQPEMRDGPISVFTVDIGMFPDERYLEPNEDLHDLTPASPERLRALIIEYLRQIGGYGHCFASLEAIYDHVLQHPLFYKQRLAVNRQELVTDKHRQHFACRLSIENSDGDTYFYLREVKYAEDLVERVVDSLISRKRDHKVNIDWVDSHLAEQAQELKKEIQDFADEQFVAERKKLLHGAFLKSFYVITGKPGSGKTRALEPIIGRLLEADEGVTVLAPTGKATLRVKRLTHFEDAQTIDMFIYKAGLSYCLDDFENILTMQRPIDTPVIENLIIDETSMVDLQRLTIILRLLELQGLHKVKRVILVGDENQLPPIGSGRQE